MLFSIAHVHRCNLSSFIFQTPALNRALSKTEREETEVALSPPESENGGFSVIDVCADRRVFDSFAADLAAADSFSVAVACDRLGSAAEADGGGGTTCGIGARIRKARYP